MGRRANITHCAKRIHSKGNRGHSKGGKETEQKWKQNRFGWIFLRMYRNFQRAEGLWSDLLKWSFRVLSLASHQSPGPPKSYLLMTVIKHLSRRWWGQGNSCPHQSQGGPGNVVDSNRVAWWDGKVPQHIGKNGTSQWLSAALPSGRSVG